LERNFQEPAFMIVQRITTDPAIGDEV
jgi:hypothetical protein